MNVPFFYDGRRFPQARAPKARAKTPTRVRRKSTERQAIPPASAFMVQDIYQTSTGDSIFHAQQYFRGLRVYGSTMVVRQIGTRLESSPVLYKLPDALETRPTVKPMQAVEMTIAFLQRRGIVPKSWRVREERVLEDASLANCPAFVEVRQGVEGPIRLHLEVCPLPRGRAVLAWVLAFELKDRRRFQVLVAAAGPRPRVLKVTQTNACAFQADWVPVPGPVDPAATFPHSVFATPDGATKPASNWQTFSGFATGANVFCTNVDSGKIEALGTLNVDNTFVWANRLHDMFSAFGFDANHHAFEDIDPLKITSQKNADKAAGDFDNFTDGAIPKMRLFKSPFSGGVHAASDPSIVIHEYAHGVSSRLVGGVSLSEPFTSKEAKGLSEGLSDYFAITILNWVARQRGLAGTVSRFGEMFHPPGGIRDYTSFTDKLPANMPSDFYRIGMIWCAGLFDGRRGVAGLVSENNADRFLWQALIDMLKSLAQTTPDQARLTLANAKQTLLVAARRIESFDNALTGASNLVEAALTARNI